MKRSLQQNLPPMEVEPVDRTRVGRSSDVDRWLATMNRAIDESQWNHKQEALAMFMDIDKAYLSRLRSGEKPWRVEHVVSLPDDIEARFEQLRAEGFGMIVVAPASGQDAVRQLVSGLVGVLSERRTA